LETIAVYWEPIIKTYGFMVKTDLSLMRLSFSTNRMAAWGERIQALDMTAGDFIMAVGHVFDGKRLQLSLLFENSRGSLNKNKLETSAKKEPRMSLYVDSPVELIYFQGPHYGDRYGIADAAFRPFVDKRLTILASACTGASIYIVVPENQARIAVKLLSEKFAVPHADDNHR
jgi:aspartokinase